MDELPQDLLGRVHRRIFSDEPGKVRLDLAVIVADQEPDLLPLRRWAEDRLRQPGTPRAVQLDQAALERMAELCGIPVADLLARLRKSAPTDPGGA